MITVVQIVLIVIGVANLALLAVLVTLLLRAKTSQRIEVNDSVNKISSLEKTLTANLTNLDQNNLNNITTLERSVVATLAQSSAYQRERLDNLSKSLLENTNFNHTALENIRTNIDANLKYVASESSKQLEKMREVVDTKLSETLELRLNQSFSLISERLEAVRSGLGEMTTLAKGVGDLKKVLTNVKVRGTWAEVQLENLLSQMLTREQYLKNVNVDPSTNERVEFAVLLPGKDDKVFIPIDSKFPIEHYSRLITASEEGDVLEIEAISKKIETSLKEEAKKISDKYVRPPMTTDFAIMYLPLEGLYGEALRRNGLVEGLQRDYRVLICGPTTLGAMLNSLQMGFKTLAIEKRSSDVLKLLNLFKADFLKFADILEKTKKKINEAGNTLDLSIKKTRTIGRNLAHVSDFNSDGIITQEQDELLIEDGDN